MSKDQLTSEVSKRICNHMNNDHRDALLGYARFLGGLPNAVNSEMLAISNKSMSLLVDGQMVELCFDHELQDSKDAHKTLKEMIEKFPKGI